MWCNMSKTEDDILDCVARYAEIHPGRFREIVSDPLRYTTEVGRSVITVREGTVDVYYNCGATHSIASGTACYDLLRAHHAVERKRAESREAELLNVLTDLCQAL